MKKLTIAQFGDPILRVIAKPLSKNMILSAETKKMISAMQSILLDKKLGVGLASTQIGESVSLAVIELQKTKIRPDIERMSLVIINPKITKVFGNKYQSWEGCISSGIEEAGLFAKVPRYKKIELEYLDEEANSHKEIFKGLGAHVIQHEVDHLNGILFVDKVKDTSTYMTYNEYRKMKRIKT